MAKKNLPYPAEKIGELLIEVDNEVAKKSDLNDFVKKESGRGLSTNDYTTAEKAKLASIQEGAQKNTVTSVRGALQLNPQVGNVVISAADIGLGDANARLTSLENNKLDKSEKGATNGVASLDENGRVPSSQLPSYVDDVIEVANYESLPTSGESGKIYITQSDNKTYRWSGNGYAEVSASLALGETEQSAYSGAKGKKNAEDIAKLAKDLDETHLLASNAESAISEVVELTIPAIETELENKLGKTEKAADSAKADSAAELSVKTTTVTSVTNAALTYHTVMAANVGSLPYGDNANAVITIPTLVGNLKYLHQLGFTGKGLFWRKMYNKDVDTTTPWSQIAFTDSTVANAEKLGNVAAADYMQKSGGTFTGNVTAPKFIGALQGNADSATKFATARKIWGQSFDGSGDINGNAKIAGQLSTDSYIVSTGAIIGGGDNVCQISNNAATVEMRVTAAGSARLMHWKDGAGKNIIGSDGSNTFLQTGNVGIGTTNPSEKLDVNGNAKAVKFIGALQGNADSATKLAAARKIWGQTFDGTGNIDGDMEINGDVVIKGNVVIEGNLTSAASYQSNPLATISEDEVPSVEQQLRAQIATLEERIAALEQLIAQNNG